MFKSVMLVSALALTTPALAQTIPGSPVITDQQTKPADTAQPTEAAPESTPATTPAAPAQDATAATAPAQDMPAQAETPAPAQSAATAAPAADAPVTGKEQIAQVVAAEFPSYDKNSDGNLDKAEFAAWMVALKKASDPTTKAEDPATQQWVGGAFASADIDKSSAVSQTELTTYLSHGAS